MGIRKAIVAGQFYPGGYDGCLAEIKECEGARGLPESLPADIVCGIVPHAGWTFSGSLAGLVVRAIRRCYEEVDTFVIFGAAHRYFGPLAAVYDKGGWVTPLGEVGIDEGLAGAIVSCGVGAAACDAHSSEHSIEVEVPFLQYYFPESLIVPIIVPPAVEAIALGESVGDLIAADKERRIVCLGSTDLTHYGPHYGFDFMGHGADGFEWAKNVNDREFIDFALGMEADSMLKSSAENQNACGAGAAAATVAAAMRLGKTGGQLLAHTSSSEVMRVKMGTASRDSVGYAAIVY